MAPEPENRLVVAGLIALALAAAVFGLLNIPSLREEPSTERQLAAMSSIESEPAIERLGVESRLSPEPETFRDDLIGGGSGPTMIPLRTGKFEMGADRNQTGHDKNEYPKREVEILEPFAIGRYEVT